jgi:ATP-dependent Clp protease ATP-binding subunit ClpA
VTSTVENRLDYRAQQRISSAQSKAKFLGSDEAQPEHVLAAILDDVDCVIYQELRTKDYKDTRVLVMAALRVPDSVVKPVRPEISEETEVLISEADAEARKANRVADANYLTLVLLDNARKEVQKIFDRLDIDREAVRTRLDRIEVRRAA